MLPPDKRAELIARSSVPLVLAGWEGVLRRVVLRNR